MQKQFKITLILTPLAFVSVVGFYVYSLWASERQRMAEAPVEAFDVMIRDLRSFHKKRGGFPRDLKELEGVVWERKEAREFSKDGSGLTHRNYHYIYAPIGHHEFTLWAVPVGRQRETAATWFLAAAPESQRRWKGPALTPEDITGLSLRPTANQLSVLGLIEQPTSLPKK
ncbi:MAG: hypothetical protein AB7F88_00415 [Pyrinomonadaceae bacterium]